MLSQLSILNLSPKVRWQEVNARYEQLSEFWAPERFSHSKTEKRVAEFRLKEIRRAYDQLREQKEQFCGTLPDSQSNVFQSLGKLRLCHKQSMLRSTRRDIHRNVRWGRLLNLLPALQPAPWGRRAFSINSLSNVQLISERIYSVVTAPIEFFVRGLIGGAHHIQLQLLFVLLLFAVLSEARLQIQAEGGMRSQKISTSQAERNSFVLQSVFQKIKDP